MSDTGRIAAVLLAAGSSRRYGPENKLLAQARGVPLALAAARALRASRIAELIVVTGHEAASIEHLLAGLGARFVHNPRHSEGIGGSIATGIDALGGDIDGALVAQADMPALAPALIDRLVERFMATGRARIVHPVGADGTQRNPVLWPRRYFPDLMRLTGDRGAKALIASQAGAAEQVPADADSYFVDLDTPEELARYNQALQNGAG